MKRETNYSSQSMNEIVFEDRNRTYGAFFLRKLYRKNMLKAMFIAIGTFVLSVLSPAIIREMGWLKDAEVMVLDTSSFILQAPPSINPLQPPVAPPKVEEVQRPTVAFLEMQAAEQDKVLDPPPTIDELEKKEIGKNKKDSTDKTSSANDLKTGGASGDGKIWTWNSVQRIPEFLGGEEAYFKYMTENMHYPEDEMEDGIEGVARVYYVVNKEGVVESAKVTRSSGNVNLDAEALRLIKAQPRYLPGRQNGEPVNVGIAVDITFKL